MSEKPVYPSVKQGVLLVLIAVALQYIVTCGLGILAASADIPIFAALAVVNILFFGGAFVYGYKRTKAPLRSVLPMAPVHPAVYLPIAAAAVGLAILFSQYVRIYDLLLEKILPDWMINQLDHDLGMSGAGLWSIVLLFIVVAPITEELLFRGLLLRGFLTHRSRWKAVWISSLLFGAAHMNLRQFLPTAVIGGMFAWWRIETGSVLPALIGHALYNLAAVLSILLYDAWATAGMLQTIILSATGALLLVLGAVLLRIYFQDQSKDANNGGDIPP